MFTALLTVFALLSVAGLIVMAIAARRAPVGFEDAQGFHAVESSARPASVMGAAIRAH
jgi:hypothetical protein